MVNKHMNVSLSKLKYRYGIKNENLHVHNFNVYIQLSLFPHVLKIVNKYHINPKHLNKKSLI